MAILGKERSGELEFLYTSVSGLEVLLADNPDFRWLNAFLQGSKTYIEDFARALDKEKITVLTNIAQTPELYLALSDDIFYLPQEFFMVYEAVLGGHDYNYKAIDVAVANGLSPEVCSTNKSSIGYQLQHLHPAPVCSVYYNSPCDNQALAADNFKATLDCPFFYVDIPDNSGKEEVDYVAYQLKNQIKFLEEHTGKKMSWDRLKAVCEESNKMAEKLYEWNQLRKAVPLPQPSKFANILIVELMAFIGSKTGTFIASENVEEVRDRIARGVTAAANEQFRVAWFGNPVSYDTTVYDFMEAELNMVVPMDLFGYYQVDWFIDTSTYENALKGLARRFLDTVPMIRHGKGRRDPFIGDWMRTVHEFQCNCAIFGGHVACKSAWGSLGLAKDIFRKADIPLLVLEYDYLDGRVNPADNLKEEMRRFRNDVLIPRLKT